MQRSEIDQLNDVLTEFLMETFSLSSSHFGGCFFAVNYPVETRKALLYIMESPDRLLREQAKEIFRRRPAEVVHGRNHFAYFVNDFVFLRGLVHNHQLASKMRCLAAVCPDYPWMSSNARIVYPDTKEYYPS